MVLLTFGVTVDTIIFEASVLDRVNSLLDRQKIFQMNMETEQLRIETNMFDIKAERCIDNILRYYDKISQAIELFFLVIGRKFFA